MRLTSVSAMARALTLAGCNLTRHDSHHTVNHHQVQCNTGNENESCSPRFSLQSLLMIPATLGCFWRSTTIQMVELRLLASTLGLEH